MIQETLWNNKVLLTEGFGMPENNSLDDLLQKTENRYALVLLAAARANELAAGEKSLIDPKDKKISIIALDEIACGKVHGKSTGGKS